MNSDPIEPEGKPKFTQSQWQLFIILVYGIAGMFYTILRRNNLYDSGALYVGLPLLLALGLSLTPKTKSALGATMKGITFALLLSAPVFQEGYICILFAAPIFYIIGGIIGYTIDRVRKHRDRNSTLQAAGIATIIALLSLEGTTDFTTFPRDNEIVTTRIIHASIDEVHHQLSKTPTFGSDKPFFISIFPYPTHISGQGLNIGDERRVEFTAYKHIWWTKVQGELVLKVSESTPNKVTFTVAKDDSYLSHYLKWQTSEVLLEPVDANNTKITWKLSYERILDPFWYFSPIQQYAVKLAAGELIDHAATPGI